MVNSISRIKPVKALIDKVRFVPINTKNYNKNLNKDLQKTVYTNIDFNEDKAITGYVHDFKVEKPPLNQMEGFIKSLNKMDIPIGDKIKTLCFIAATSTPYTQISDKEGVHSFVVDNEDTKYYNKIVDLATKQRGGDYNGARGSCAQAACHIISLLYDDKLTSAGPLEQYNYFSDPNNNKWKCMHEKLNTGEAWPADLKTGDVVVSVNTKERGGHVLIYVGEDNGAKLFYEAAYYQRDDGLYSSTYPVIDRIDNVENKEGRQSYIFRPTGK